LKLETLPKAINKGSTDEVAFLSYVFALVAEWVSIDNSFVERAIQFGIDHHVRNLDTIHAASAERIGVDQFVTSELQGKPYFAIPSINAVNLLDATSNY